MSEGARRTRRPLLAHVTTVPMSMVFFRGQIGYLQSRGFDVAGISSPGVALEEAGRREGMAVYGVPMAREMSPLNDLVSLWRLWRLLRRLRPAVVHSHTPKAGLLGTIAARLARTDAVVLSIFGLAQMTRTGFSRRLLDSTTRLACRLAHRVWCDSFSMRDYVVEQGLCPADKVVVLGKGSVNGVDAAGRFSPDVAGSSVRRQTRQTYGISHDALVIGFVGRVVGDKGMHELAVAWRELRERHADAQLLLVGPFEDKDPLTPEDQQTFHDDPRVHLAGMQRDVAPFFAAMDVFVMPSYREGFGITNIEAAAMALPVVSTRIPGCVDSVEDGVTGLLVAVRDADALTRAIDRYLADPELRRQHGTAGRARVLRDFRPESIWDELYNTYDELLARGCRGDVERSHR